MSHPHESHDVPVRSGGKLSAQRGKAAGPGDDLQAQRARFELGEEDVDEDDENWRHSYRQERDLHDAIAGGDADEALRLTAIMDHDAGRLAPTEFDHWRTLSIIALTIAARAAIDGGLGPRTAYRLSGFYIIRVNQCTDSAQVLELRNTGLRELADQVRGRREHLRTSSYTETAKNYIAQHYREKLYLEDIAEHLKISPSHLSRIFSRETGQRLQDYIVDVRVDRAANLLRYSELSLSEIAAYVNFPSQSYFGKVFKARLNMTPRAYRDRYRAAEWIDEAAPR